MSPWQSRKPSRCRWDGRQRKWSYFGHKIHHLPFLFLSPDPVLQGESFWQRKEAKAGLRDPAQLSSKGFGGIIYALTRQDWPEVCGPLFKEKKIGKQNSEPSSSKASGKSDHSVQKLNSSQFLILGNWNFSAPSKDMSHSIERQPN